MTFQLESLGRSFRIERTEECVPRALDNSYAEMIRVRGSWPKLPYFKVPSHIFKYSESELGLYLRDHKRLWRPLGELMNVDIDIHDTELMLHFPIAMFPRVAKIVPFIRKALRRVPFTEEEKQKMTRNLHRGYLQIPREMDLNGSKLNENEPESNSISTIPDNMTLK